MPLAVVGGSVIGVCRAGAVTFKTALPKEASLHFCGGHSVLGAKLLAHTKDIVKGLTQTGLHDIQSLQVCARSLESTLCTQNTYTVVSAVVPGAKTSGRIVQSPSACHIFQKKVARDITGRYMRQTRNNGL